MKYNQLSKKNRLIFCLVYDEKVDLILSAMVLPSSIIYLTGGHLLNLVADSSEVWLRVIYSQRVKRGSLNFKHILEAVLNV